MCGLMALVIAFLPVQFARPDDGAVQSLWSGEIIAAPSRVGHRESDAVTIDPERLRNCAGPELRPV